MRLDMVVNWQFEHLQNDIKAVEWILSMSDSEALTTYRDGGSGWTALEALCHLRDFEAIFLERAKQAVEQDNPPLANIIPDELAAEGHYNEQSAVAVLEQWKALRAEYIAYLRERTDADWERTAVHPRRGLLTLLEQLFVVPLHDSIHMEQLTRTLNEKKLPA